MADTPSPPPAPATDEGITLTFEGETITVPASSLLELTAEQLETLRAFFLARAAPSLATH